MGRRIFAIILLLLAISIAVSMPVLVYTPYGNSLLSSTGLLVTPTPTPSPTPIPTPSPTPTPQPVLTVKGTPPEVQATIAYLIDMDTGNVLNNVNGEKPVPMASTTKIMTALIAIQTGNLDQLITIEQSAYDHAHNNGGSHASLQVGDKLTLRDLLYGLMLASGDDAAIAIAQALGGTVTQFVERMNLFAYRLRLFQTHFSNPDGLTLDGHGPHYTSAADLVRLTQYAMTIPFFAKMVQTQTYTVPATGENHRYTWNNTNKLLKEYPGMKGVKTGFTYAAGYCLVFMATRNGHTLIGVVLNSPNEEQRSKDVTTLLNWGFALPVLPPSH